jgi:PAS domain S-box-containing protein
MQHGQIWIVEAVLAGLALGALILALLWIRRRTGKPALGGASGEHGYFAAVFRSIGDGLIVCGADGRITSMNPVAEQLCGWPAAEAAGQPIERVFRIVNAHTRQPAPNPVPRAIAEGTATGLANDTLLISRSGREIAIADSCAPIFGSESTPIGAVLVFRDVTELYRVHRELAESERRYRLLAEHSLAAVAIHELLRDDQGRIVDSMLRSANRQFSAQSGLDADQLLGKRLTEWLPAKEAARWLARFDEVDRNGRALFVEEDVDPLGRRFLVQVWPVQRGTIGVAFMDVTHVRQSELRAARLGRLLEVSSNEVYVFEAETLRFVEASRSALDSLGYTLEELRQLTPLDLKPEFDRQTFETLLAPLRKRSQSRLQFHTVHRRKDGSTYPVDVRLELIEEGSRRLFLAVIENVAEREEAERKWREQHEQLQAIFGSARDAIVMLDPSRRILLWSPASEALFGFSAEQAAGQCLGHLVRMEPVAGSTENLQTLALLDWLHCGGDEMPAVSRATVTAYKNDGSPVAIELSVAPADIGGLTHFVAVLRDVSEPLRLRQQLAESEHRYRIIVEHAADLVWTVSGDGRITYASPSWKRVTGYRPEELQGMPFRPGIHPDDWPSASDAFSDLLHGRVQERSLAYRVLHADGSWHWHEGRAVAVRDPGGCVVSIVGVSRDISPQRQAEEELKKKMQELEAARQGEQAKASALAEALQQLEEARQRAEQASRAKTDFLAKMSHEMRTPLNAILGMAEILRYELTGPEKVERLEAILSSCRNLLHLIDELLDVSAIEAGRIRLDREPFSVAQLLDDALGELALAAAQKGLELIGCIRPGTPHTLVGDVRRLLQILLNLASNAIKYTREGQVRICLAWRQAQQPDVEGTFEISVADTGPGIPSEKIPVVFEKFAQLDESGQHRAGGVGLGLAIVRQLVDLMKGEVAVESILGKGSTFTVSIPIERATATGLHQPRPPQTDSDVWVISKLPERRRAAAETLRWLGATALEADSLTSVSQHIRQHGPQKTGLLLWADEYSVSDIANCRQMIRNLGGREPNILVTKAATGPAEITDGIICLSTPLRCLDLQTALIRTGILPPISETRITLPESNAPTPQRLVSPLKRVASPRSKILVAEDNHLNRRVAAGLLAKLGLECDLVSNGREAIEALRRNRYDLVLLDLSMPEMDGLEAARCIRQECGHNNLQPPPLVALTAHVLPEDRRRCIEAGMNDFLAKPISLAALAEVLTRWIPGLSIGRPGEPESRAFQPGSPDRPLSFDG